MSTADTARRVSPALLPILLVLPRPTLAATLVVDAGGGGDHTLIQSAVDAANSGDSIEVRAGTYAETVSIDGKSLDILGAGSSSVTVQADGAAAALAIDGGGTLEVSGLTLAGGDRGLTVRISDVTAVDVVIDGNSVSGNGGGVGVFEGAEVTLEDCTISDNEALTVYHGGAIYVDASTLVMDGCTVSGNEAEQGGRAVFRGCDHPAVGLCLRGQHRPQPRGSHPLAGWRQPRGHRGHPRRQHLGWSGWRGLHRGLG